MRREDIPYKVGDAVKLISRSAYGSLNPGDVVTVIDIQDGTFAGDFYAIVSTEDGRKACAYSWRFAPVNHN